MRFELRDAWRGWRHADTPDNLTIECALEGETRVVDASIGFLCELYGHVKHRELCHLVGGTGTAFEIRTRPEGVRFIVNYSWSADTTFSELEAELVPLLRESFTMHDRLSSDRRDAELARIQDNVDAAGVGYDVRDCYETLGA